MAEQLESPGDAKNRLQSAAWLVGVLLFQMVTVGRHSLEQFYFVDDFLQFMFAAGPLTKQYLIEPVFQHLVPAYRLIYWIIQHAFTMKWEAAVVFIMGFLGLTSVVLFLLLRRFCGVNASGLLVLIWAASPVQFRMAGWAAGGLEPIPCCFFSVLALERMLAYWGQGRKRDLGFSLLAMALGLCFLVKALLVPGYLGLLWLLFPRLRPQEHTRSRTLASLVGTVLVGGLYLFIFLKYFYFPMNMGGNPKPTVPEVLGFIGNGTLRVFLPSYAGVPPQYTTGFLIFGSVLAAIFLAACLWIRGAWRAAVFFVMAAVPNLAIVAFARMKVFPDGVILLELRYYSELTYLFTLSLGLVLWLRPRTQALSGEAAPAPGSRLHAAGLVLAVLAVCVQRGVLSQQAAEGLSIWDTRSVRKYMGNFMAGLEEVRRLHEGHYERYSFFNAEVPGNVMPDWFGGWNRYGDFFLFLDPRIQSDVSASTMYMLDELGRVHPAELSPLGEAVLEEGKACLNGGEGARYSLPAPLDVKVGTIEVEFDQPVALNGAIQLSASTDFEHSRLWFWNRDAKVGSSYVTFTVKEPLRYFWLSLAGDSSPGCVKRIRVGNHRLDPTVAFPSVSAQR